MAFTESDVTRCEGERAENTQQKTACQELNQLWLLEDCSPVYGVPNQIGDIFRCNHTSVGVDRNKTLSRHNLEEGFKGSS